MYPTSPKNAIRLSSARQNIRIEAPFPGAHHRASTLGNMVDVSVIAPSLSKAKARAEFSLEVRLPDGEPGNLARVVRYCDACRRWGQQGSVHLCGRNWHEHLGELLATLAAGGGR